jgi:hypothetical protein
MHGVRGRMQQFDTKMSMLFRCSVSKEEPPNSTLFLNKVSGGAHEQLLLACKPRVQYQIFPILWSLEPKSMVSWSNFHNCKCSLKWEWDSRLLLSRDTYNRHGQENNVIL